ncbi:putative heme-binding protein 2-like [Apostichopus japonicus]|uniref:Putative heme-binding protein 2-like n=1 Tax=Stichopus japonicus TaxID=307972 RepID=A0A2G8K0S8_STIJA|nr:putative heme-binding protein 2-like [Apostichopus japonicus]
MWVTTIVNTTSYEEGGRIGFRRLFSYISGDNSQNVRIKMTKPVRKRILREEVGESGYQNNLYLVSFFVPPKFFNTHPEPLNNETFIELESSYVYAFNFSGWAYESRITEMYNNLSDFLQETDQPMVASEFSVQGYDSPRTSSGRHNEILIPVDSDFGEPTCGPTTTEQPTMLPPNGITQCLRNECPTYTERSSLSDRIVIREVSAGVYASKRSTTCNMSAVMDETYMPLRKYFLGSNSERLRIPATVPILQLGVRPERVSASCNFTYQTSFYIPERYQKAPPTRMT